MEIEPGTLLPLFNKFRQSSNEFVLKGPKHDIFGSGFFYVNQTSMDSDLGTRTKNLKLGWFRPENRHFVLFSAVGYSAKDLLML